MSQQYFTKTNSSNYADALERESEGLDLLRATLASLGIHELSVPDVILAQKQSLVIRYIDARQATEQQMNQLGRGLAKLHLFKYSYYGLEKNNYIGMNAQMNCVSHHWGSFFVEQRLAYQISLIQDARLKAKYSQVLSKTKQSLANFLDEHCAFPSLLHGDLWSGNVLFDASHVWLIDPAVYYGDREVDLAMTEMFGGFSRAFYDAYHEVSPLSKEYEAKKRIYNLYHYLNHYNLFGASYLEPCDKSFEFLMRL